jgi:hypothetical protein
MDRTLRRARLAVTITFIVNGFAVGIFVGRIHKNHLLTAPNAQE